MQIRPRKFPRLKGVRYEVDLGMVEQADGSKKRVQRFFRKKEAAQEFLDEQKRKRKQFGDAALAFTEQDRMRFVAAQERLESVGATIEQAVDYYLRTHKPLKLDENGLPITMGRMLARCLFEKEIAGLADRSLRQLKSSCLSFIRGKEDLPAKDVTKDQVKKWILGNGFAAKTERTYLGDLRTLFSFGVSEGYLATNVIAGEDGFIDLTPEEDREIPALDVEDCTRLLRFALVGSHRTRARDRATGQYSWTETPGTYRPLLGYIAITLFAGVRPEREAGKTTIDDLDLRGRVLLIRGSRAKTRRRRPVELPRVAVVWLRLWRRLCPRERQFMPKNFKRLWDDLRRQAGLFETWEQDVLRHTAASCHYAFHQKLSELQAWLGHTEDEDTLFRHYRAVFTRSGRVVSKALAKQFWSLTPRRVRQMS